MGRPSKDKAVDYSKPLKNAKYERFCQEFIVDNNGAQAVIRAGYSKIKPDSRAAKLAVIDSIKNRRAYLQQELSEKSGVTATMITNEFKKIAFGRVTKTLTRKNKIAALENLGKHVGYYEKDNSQKKDNLADFLKAMKDG